jgi:hypothetical protein
MSIATDRADLAELLSTVDGVTGHPYKPSAPTSGDAWPRRVEGVREMGLVWRPTWEILVWLPADFRAADDWVDLHVADLIETLSGDDAPGFVERWETGLMQTGTKDRPVLVIELKTVG